MNVNITLKEYFPRLLRSRKFMAYFVIFILLVAGLFFLSGKLFISYQDAKHNQQKIDEIQSFLQTFSEQKQFLESINVRPIKASQLDDILADIFKNIKKRKLNISKFDAKSATGDSKHSRDFEMVLTGPYVPLMEFLRDFHAKDALLSIKFLELKKAQTQSEKGLMQAEILYTIYLR